MTAKGFSLSEVIENEVLNEKFRRIVFKLKHGSGGLTFRSGQFVIIKIPTSSGVVFRDYSISTLPDKLPVWETIVDITPNGPGCRYLSSLKAGDLIETSSPLGTFVLKNNKPGHYLMIATGSGIASIKPMVEELAKNKKNSIDLLWGLRFVRDIFYPELYGKNVVLSRPDESWDGKTGHVTDFLTKADSAYLCGNEGMIMDVGRALKKMGMSSKKIFFEKYF